MTGRRVAVTGVGLIGALGAGASRTFSRLVAGDRGFSRISLFDTAGQRTDIAGEVPDFSVASATPRNERWSRSDALALTAATEAFGGFRRSRNGRSRLGVAVGVTTGGMLEGEALLSARESSPSARTLGFASYPISSTAARLARVFAPVERVGSLCSACSSGANAVLQGVAWLQTGAVDAALVGGTDALCRLTLSGFNALGATDTTPCRPFDRTRGGLTLGEGAGFLLLETEESAVARGAPVLAWLSGWAMASEAFHVTQPEPSARMPAALIERAMQRAGLEAEDVDYVNAHGTGTLSNDSIETTAIHAAFGEHGRRILVSSSKGQLGHTLGAAGAIEAVVTVLSLAEQRVPPTGGLVEPDDACALNHVMNVGRAQNLRAAVSSSFGFGGTGAVLLFERADSRDRSSRADMEDAVVVTGAAGIGAGRVVAGERCVDALAPSSVERIPMDVLGTLEPSRSRRFDLVTALTTAGAESALRAANLAPAGVGLIVGSAFGGAERTAAFLRTVVEKGPRRAPPAEFPHLVPSAASGNAAIYLGLSGPVITTSALDASTEVAVLLACDLLKAGFVESVVAGGAEAPDGIIGTVLAPACIAPAPAEPKEASAWLVLELASVVARRGAKPRAVLRGHFEIPWIAVESSRVEAPKAIGRPVVVTSRDATRLAPLLTRCGWGAAEVRNVAPAFGSNEGAGGFALAAAVELLGRREATEALVCGFNADRLFVFHFVGPD